MFQSPPTRLKPMVPMSWTNTNDPNESQRTWPCHWTWPMRSRTLELSSWQQPKVFPSDDRGCALLPVSHLGFKVKSNAWLGLSSQQHNSHCIFQLLEQSVFGGCCCFFLQKMIPILCEKYIQWTAGTHESLSTPTPALGNGMCLKILSKWSSKQAGQSGRHF
jgi:hypothetical protein